MRRFFVDAALDGEFCLKAADVGHVKKVLRMRPGDKLLVTGGNGVEAVAEITGLDGEAVRARVVEFLPERAGPPLRVILGQGLGKGDKMDFIVQKAVELGVSDIVPLALDRSVASYEGEKKIRKRERWQKIAEQAAKQCRRGLLPAVHQVQSLPAALQEFTAGIKIICYEKEQANSLRSVMKNLPDGAASLFLLIGPEGGFTPDEAQAAAGAGFTRVSLGPLVLRTETAAVAALAVIMYELADFGG